MKNTIYDHYIAIDWAATNMAIARMTKKLNRIQAFDVPADIAELKFYLLRLNGTKILALEETNTSQWLYTELKDHVDRIYICDPYRNRLLSEGPKTDKIDATKLVRLLKAGLMKEVYHSTDKFIYLRRLVSGYEDLIKAGVRLQNQRYSLLRVCGKTGYEDEVKLSSNDEQFVLDCLDRQIEAYKTEKKGYEKEFKKLSRKHPEIKHQTSIPGIGYINAVKIVARVVTPHRFPEKGHYLSYVGLIKHEKMSGGKSYGKKNPRYCRMMKSVYKSGVLAATRGNNPINDYYEYLIKEKGYPEYNARNMTCRKLAIISLGVFKNGKKYQPWRNHVKDN
ncbi:MAG: transposase [Proteobacteria bacterium]|nr:transposase [Pseudomonadota bacterium]MBU1543970.1 transposase [Pseudomonadota bacterium]MBU2431605.1 transposase [Pseudomonadota bacterium]MBU2479945.1 transposase [Pseudomonadota bacterium]